MSIAIDNHKVESVLLPDGKWYSISEKSFTVDTYEFTEEGKTVAGGSQHQGAPAIGVAWKDNMGKKFACPFTAILAIRYT